MFKFWFAISVVISMKDDAFQAQNILVWFSCYSGVCQDSLWVHFFLIAYLEVWLLTQGSDGKGHFIFVTNLIPCSGVRIHLWPERSKTLSEAEVSSHKRILEATTRMIQIPAGPAPRQVQTFLVFLLNLLV